MTLSDTDQVKILEYLDGKFSTTAMVEFEIRLTNEPELAEAFESFEEMDLLQRRAIGAHSRPRRFRWLRGGMGLAAAAALIVTLSLWFGRGKGDTTLHYAVVSSGATWEQFGHDLNLDEHWSAAPPTLDRGSGSADFPHQEYFDHISPVQEARYEEALVNRDAPAPLTHFNLVLKPDEDCSVLVLMFDHKGDVFGAEGFRDQVAFPVLSPWTNRSGRLLSGEVAVLPSRNLTWVSTNESESQKRVVHKPGFVVPRGAEQLNILIGLRQQPLDSGTEQALGELLQTLSLGPSSAENSSSRLHSWLLNEGFEVEVTSVTEK